MGRALSRATPEASEPRRQTARSEDALERIAGTLGVPVAAFFPDADAPDPALAQAADLVAAFVAIDNPAARRTCLAFVQAMARS